MVRRAKVPDWIKQSGRISHRELSGWPEGVAYSPSRKKTRKKRKKVAKVPSGVPSVEFTPKRLEVGVALT